MSLYGEDVIPHHSLVRQMEARHIAMISIGGAIGTGVFLGSGSSLADGGPLGLWLGYVSVASICYAMMVSLGEMVSFLPIPGGHIALAERFVSPALSFAMGWNYWYSWAITLPAELSAAAVLINYWISASRVNNAAWISICIVVVIGINSMGARAYGEAEFWFVSIKVLTIIGLIIVGIILDLGGGPSHDRIGFRYWKNPGLFVQYHKIPGVTGRFAGWWAAVTQAAYSFTGAEIVGIAAGEAKNPRKTIPKAIKVVYVLILLFYILGTFIVGLIVPSNNVDLGVRSNAFSSPFVIAIRNAGTSGLPSVINAALLTSAWSAASSDLYTASRAIYGLAISTMPLPSLLFSGFSVFLKDNWDTANFITNYIPYILSPLLYLFGRYVMYRGAPPVAASEMDFVSGIAEIEADSYEEEPPKSLVEKLWKWLI
ncbi:hypothetical protein DL93DRAFT_2167944 [Clavulina sp. PMI_390]|nr:hypothetical protein DL93DRAFT_2167944 [Clavulina sp. PMI_390]